MASMLLLCYPKAMNKEYFTSFSWGYQKICKDINLHKHSYLPPTLTSETEKWITVWGEKDFMEICWNNWGLSLLFIKGRFQSSYWSPLGSLGIKARIETCIVLHIFFPILPVLWAMYTGHPLNLKESPEEQPHFTAQIKCDPESVSLSTLAAENSATLSFGA